MRQLGCSTLTFRMLDRANALAWIAEEGFKTIDLGVIAKFCPHVDPLTTSDDHNTVVRSNAGDSENDLHPITRSAHGQE